MTGARLAHGIGAGLLAGLAGTAALTAVARAEARLRRRHAERPAAAVAKRALGIERFESPRAESRFDGLAHWGYGAVSGAAYGTLRALGLGPRPATAVQWGAMWAGALVVLPSHDLAPPIMLRRPADVAAEAAQHLVYAAAAGLAFERLRAR